MTWLRKWVLPFIVYLLYRGFRLTWRVHYNEPEWVKEKLLRGEPFILAHWHGDIMGLVHMVKRYNVVTIVSQSKDGDVIDMAIKFMGGKTVRGSSTRGGAAALKALLKLSREGYRPCLAVDGPKGPIYVPKPGVFETSRLLKMPIYPLVAVASKSFQFNKAWDKGFLPKPFSDVHIFWGEPMAAIAKEPDTSLEELGQRLAQSLINARSHGAKLVALS